MSLISLRKVDKLVLSEFIPFFFIGVGAFTLLMVAVTLFREMLNLVTSYGLGPAEVGMFFILALPQTVAYTFPMAVLFAGLLAFGRMSDSSEITALRASGISFFRIVLPALLFAWVVVLATFMLSEKIAPQSTRAGKMYIHRALLAKGISLQEEDISYMDHEAGWLFAAASGQGNEFIDVKWWDFSRPDFATLTTADKGIWETDRWIFINARVLTVRDGNYTRIMTSPELEMQISRTPSDILAEGNRDPQEMSLQELSTFLDSGAADERSESYIRKIKGTYHLKIALPFASIMFTLIAAPLGLAPQRSTSTRGVGISMVLVFIYYMLTTFAVKIAEGGILAPIVAAWMPNILFLIAGAVLNGRFYVRSA